MNNTVTRQSKVNPNVTYVSHTVASWKYLYVQYGKYTLYAYNNKPIKHILKAIQAWETAMPSMPSVGDRHDSEAADAMVEWISTINVEYRR